MADLTAEEEEKQVHHRGCAPHPRGRKWSLMYLRLVKDSASAIREVLQKEQMAALTSSLYAFFGGGEIRVWRGSGREYCWLISLTWVNQEFLMLWWRTYRPC